MSTERLFKRTAREIEMENKIDHHRQRMNHFISLSDWNRANQHKAQLNKLKRLLAEERTPQLI